MNQWRNALWMSERGHKVVLFVREDTPVEEAARESGLVVARVNKHRKYYDYLHAKQLKRKIKHYGVTHLIVRDPQDMGLCALTKTLMGNKLFLAYFMEMQLGIQKKDFLHTLRFKQYDLWACPLPWLAKQVEELTNFPKERIQLIPSALDLSKFHKEVSKAEARQVLKISNDRKWIGLIGRFDEQKGQLLLLKAFNKIKDKLPQHDLIFLGEKTKGEAEDYYDEMLHYIERKGLTHRIEIRPFRNDVETFYSALDIFVMATKAETFGMVTIEAMASGCKIVGSNAGGTPEILGDGKFGTLFKSGNSKDLSNALIKASEKSPVNSVDMEKEVNKYDYQEVCEKVEKAIF
jgi:glycosyltransferase involved in cell wall biosynthesis